MNTVFSSDIENKDVYIKNWTPEYPSGYQDFWQDVFKRSNPQLKQLNMDAIENKWINLFPLIVKKSFRKRASEGSNSVDMPVVFMPQKSVTDCVSKPKVIHKKYKKYQ